MPAELDREVDGGVPAQVSFRSSRVIDLCGRCGHENDHVGKACRHEGPNGPCQCKSGVRTDVLLCIQGAEQLRVLQELRNAIGDLFMLTLEAHGFEIDSEGQLAKKSGIVIPQ